MLKVIIATDGIFPFTIGGMQRHSRLLIEELAKRKDIDLKVIHPHGDQKIFETLERVQEIGITGINTDKNYLLECYLYSVRVFNEIKKYPEYLIYSQGLSVWHNIKAVSARLIINPHGLEPYQTINLKENLIGLPFRKIFNYLFRNAAYTVSLGGKLTHILKKNRAKQIALLPNGVYFSSLPFERDFDVPKLHLLFVGRFAPNKGIPVLLDAIKELNEDGYKDKLHFNLAGKGPLWDEYVKSRNYSNLTYWGFITDEQLIELYKTNDVFILPTLFEGMPTVILEAMSYKMPVIVTDVGATAELVDATNGYLINKNSISELKNAIIAYYESTVHQKKEYALNSYKKASKYNWTDIAQKHVEVFKTLDTQIKSKLH